MRGTTLLEAQLREAARPRLPWRTLPAALNDVGSACERASLRPALVSACLDLASVPPRSFDLRTNLRRHAQPARVEQRQHRGEGARRTGHPLHPSMARCPCPGRPSIVVCLPVPARSPLSLPRRARRFTTALVSTCLDGALRAAAVHCRSVLPPEKPRLSPAQLRSTPACSPAALLPSSPAARPTHQSRLFPTSFHLNALHHLNALNARSADLARFVRCDEAVLLRARLGSEEFDVDLGVEQIALVSRQKHRPKAQRSKRRDRDP